MTSRSARGDTNVYYITVNLQHRRRPSFFTAVFLAKNRKPCPVPSHKGLPYRSRGHNFNDLYTYTHSPLNISPDYPYLHGLLQQTEQEKTDRIKSGYCKKMCHSPPLETLENFDWAGLMIDLFFQGKEVDKYRRPHDLYVVQT